MIKKSIEDKNGYASVRLSSDRTQAFVMIYPPTGQGNSITTREIIQRLRIVGVTYGFQEKAIEEGIRQARNLVHPVEIVGAEGIVPKEGHDAKIRFLLEPEILREPLPKHPSIPQMPNWFALNPKKRVNRNQTLANIIPMQPGTQGKTLTYPIQLVPCRHGKPATLLAGDNVGISEDGLHLFALKSGYATLVGEKLVVLAVKEVFECVQGGHLTLSKGAIFHDEILHSQISSTGTLAVQGRVYNSSLRAHGDILVSSVEMSRIVAGGNVYVTREVRNCEIITQHSVIMLDNAPILGGTLRAIEGISAYSVGEEQAVATSLEVGVDHYSAICTLEIEATIRSCQTIIARIKRILQYFLRQDYLVNQPAERILIFQKLQAHLRTQELRLKNLLNLQHEAKAGITIRLDGEIRAQGTIYPGVIIQCGRAQMRVGLPLRQKYIRGINRGHSIQIEALEKVA